MAALADGQDWLGRSTLLRRQRTAAAITATTSDLQRGIGWRD
jgi:hypothetical protein